MNIQKCRNRNEKAFRKECIKEHQRLYNQISGCMNDGYSEYSFKMKGTRAETVVILALLSRFDWLSGEKFCKPMGDFMDVKYTYFYKFSWQ